MDPIMKPLKYFILPFTLFLSITSSKAQLKGLEVHLLGSPFFTSNRTDKANSSELLYKELRIQSKFGQYLSLGLFVGHQIRNKGEYLITYVDVPGTFIYQEGLSKINRTYIPLGIFAEIDFTSFFCDELKILKRKEQWKIYNNIQLVHLTGNNEYFRTNPNGLYILGFHKFEKDYGRSYIGFMFGARRYINEKRSFSVCLEAGKGALMNAQLGLGLHFTRQRQ